MVKEVTDDTIVISNGDVVERVSRHRVELAPSPLDRANEPRVDAGNSTITEVTTQPATLQRRTVPAGIPNRDTVSRGLVDLPIEEESSSMEPFARKVITDVIHRVLDPKLSAKDPKGQDEDSDES